MLTDMQAKRAQPAEKDYKLSDSGGLYLFVTKGGTKSWRMKYRYGNKEQRLVFGQYPTMTLAQARALRDDARALLRDNRNPALERRKAKLVNAKAADETFEKIGRRWHELQSPRWAPVHADDVLQSLVRDVFPDLGAFPLAEINAPLVLATLRKVEKRGSIETAKRLRQRISGIFVFGISEGLCENDPAAIVTKALKPRPKKTKQPALTDIDEVRKVLIAAESSGAYPVTKLASRLLALTIVRPGVLRRAEWTEFEGIDWDSDATDEPIWRVPAAKMKLVLDQKDDEAFEHIVPLVPAAVDVLRQVRRMTGRCTLVFPGQRHAHKPLSENAIGYLYNRVGFHGRHVPHGWRAAFSTKMNELAVKLERPQDVAVVELMLAHVPENKVKAAYDRAGHMERRRALAQEWADMLLDGLEPAATLLDGPRR